MTSQSWAVYTFLIPQMKSGRLQSNLAKISSLLDAKMLKTVMDIADKENSVCWLWLHYMYGTFKDVDVSDATTDVQIDAQNENTTDAPTDD